MARLSTPPGPDTRFGGLGLANKMRQNPIAAFQDLSHFETDLVYYQLGPYRVYMVKHPDLVHEVLVSKAKYFHKWSRQKQIFGKFDGDGLVNSDGDFWRRQRKLMQPAFHSQRIHAYADTMVAYTQRQVQPWQAGSPINVGAEISALTRDIVTKTLFNADVTDETRKIGEVIGIIQEMAFREFGELVTLPDWMPHKRREREALQFLDSVIHRFIRERRAAQSDEGDLLSMLLMAGDAGDRMTDKQVRDEAMTLFIAGHETTATALAWVYVLLATHPDVEAKVLAEVDALGGKTLGFEDVPKLKMTEWVIRETLRLYPPTYFFPREVAEPVEIGGYALPKGALIHIPVYTLHHDPRFWTNAESFDPERFAPERFAAVPDYAYFPFGGGPRVCIGNAFAMMEMQLIIATIAQRFLLTAPVGMTMPDLLPLVTLLPKGGVHLRVKQRAGVPVPG